MTVKHFVGGAVVAAGRNGITTGHRSLKGLQPHATGQDVPLREDDPKPGQDEMTSKRKYTKTRGAGGFFKFPGANSITSIAVRDGITTLSA
jgi:hypothetical protein